MSNPIQNMLAIAHVTVCKVAFAAKLNVTGYWSFKHVGLAPVSLWMLRKSRAINYAPNDRVQVSTEQQDFEFAIQAGFDGSSGSVSIGDEITDDSGDVFMITGPINADDTGTIFTCSATCKTVRQV